MEELQNRLSQPKKIWKISFILFGITLALGIFALALLKNEALGYTSFTVAIISFILVVYNGKKMMKIERSYCSSCGYHYDLSEDVDCKIVRSRNEDGMLGKKCVATVEFTCLCPRCRKKQSFKQSFTVASEISGTKNIEYLIEKYFV